MMVINDQTGCETEAEESWPCRPQRRLLVQGSGRKEIVGQKTPKRKTTDVLVGRSQNTGGSKVVRIRSEPGKMLSTEGDLHLRG